MTAFEEVALSKLLNEFGEEPVEEVLSEFVCKENEEVEDFIRSKAISHEKRGLAKTILIIDTAISSGQQIVGYYTISTKSLLLSDYLNSSQKKKYFGTSQIGGGIIPSILIGQLGKNEAATSSFTGTNLIDLIFRYICRMSETTPSVVSYVEHDGREKLIHFYEKHGFMYFPRKKEEAEKNLFCHIIKTKDIISMIDDADRL